MAPKIRLILADPVLHDNSFIRAEFAKLLKRPCTLLVEQHPLPGFMVRAPWTFTSWFRPDQKPYKKLQFLEIINAFSEAQERLLVKPLNEGLVLTLDPRLDFPEFFICGRYNNIAELNRATPGLIRVVLEPLTPLMVQHASQTYTPRMHLGDDPHHDEAIALAKDIIRHYYSDVHVRIQQLLDALPKFLSEGRDMVIVRSRAFDPLALLLTQSYPDAEVVIDPSGEYPQIHRVVRALFTHGFNEENLGIHAERFVQLLRDAIPPRNEESPEIKPRGSQPAGLFEFPEDDY